MLYISQISNQMFMKAGECSNMNYEWGFTFTCFLKLFIKIYVNEGGIPKSFGLGYEIVICEHNLCQYKYVPVLIRNEWHFFYLVWNL